MDFNATFSIIQVIEEANGGAFVQKPVRHNVREFLKALLNSFGITDAKVHRLVSDDDLIMLYSTARGSKTTARRLANRLAAKYGDNPLLDDAPAKSEPSWPSTFTPKVQETPSAPTPSAPTPSAPTPSAPDMSQYAKRSYVDAFLSAQRNKLSEVQEYSRETRANLTDTLLRFTDALPDTVQAQVAKALQALTPVTLNVVTPNSAPVAMGMVHRKTPAILQMLSAGVNVYLHGPAGSGKTTVGRKCAEAFGLPFYFAAKVESEYMLLGFKDARGETVRTQFREAYEHGGVFLFDELDGSSPSAVVALNAALANGICPFPDGVIIRHENFKCIAAGNTKLSGATREYVGRNQLDAASVDRFAFVEFGYDDALETALATNADWCKFVQSARKAVAERALKHLVTPRATYDGCKLLEAGLTWSEVASAVLWKGLDAETVRQLETAMTVKAPKPVEIL